MAYPGHTKAAGYTNLSWFKPRAITQTVEERAATQKMYYERHKVKTTRRNWERQIRELGCTPELYAELLEKQGGVCAICLGVNKYRRKLAVDHCHKTGRIRALLCNACNCVLGLVKEDPVILRAMERYLAV